MITRIYLWVSLTMKGLKPKVGSPKTMNSFNNTAKINKIDKKECNKFSKITKKNKMTLGLGFGSGLMKSNEVQIKIQYKSWCHLRFLWNERKINLL